MRSINNRPFLRRFKNKIHDGFFHLRVKLRCRLIHQKHIERAQQASSDIDPLAFPAGNCIQIFSQISCVTFYHFLQSKRPAHLINFSLTTVAQISHIFDNAAVKHIIFLQDYPDMLP